MRWQVGKLTICIEYSNWSGDVLVMTSYHIAFGPRHALGSPPCVLQIQSFPQVIVIDSCLWHDWALFVEIRASCGDEFCRLREPIGVDPVKATTVACQTLVIVQHDVAISTCSILHHLVLKHKRFTMLALPLHWKAFIGTGWHASGESGCGHSMMLVSCRVWGCRVVLDLIDLHRKQHALLFGSRTAIGFTLQFAT